jgi:PPK2 family polyphosphate:nucleotide phosphotransferase
MPLDRYRVRHGDRRALDRIDPRDIGSFSHKADALKRLDAGLKRLDALQERLYASDRYSLLLIFQGLDAAGKDSAIKHVLSGVNPQGTEVRAFKVPSAEELAHDYLWRAVKALPGRGRIGIFNRSYYEDVLVVRVHDQLLANRKLPADRVTKRIWDERFEDIGDFERHLDRNATIVRKFFLHVSKKEQRERLLARLDDPAKHWKFSIGDLAERDLWPKYRHAYSEAIAATSRKHAPWYIVPADHKWFAHLVIADVIIETLESLDLTLPKPDKATRREIDAARKRLKA